MGKQFSIQINRFDGGMMEDKRIGWSSGSGVFFTDKFSLTKHFDAFTLPHSLIPLYKTKAFEGEDKAKGIVKYIYASRNFPTDTSFKLYGYGIDTGTTKAQVFMRDPTETSWSTPTNNKSTNTGRDTKIFFYYKGFIYMLRTGGNLMRFDVTSSAVFEEAYQAIGAYTNSAEPTHHPADDCAYFFLDNKVYRLNNTSWDGLVLTLPSNMKIVSATPHGNYLAIGCVTLGDLAVKSIVFLWDRDSSLTTLTERIDFGDGSIEYLHSVYGNLFSVMSFYPSSAYANKRAMLLVKVAIGNQAKLVNFLTSDVTSGIVVYQNKVVKNDRLYFPAKVQLNGDTRIGIWSMDSNGELSLEIVNPDATSFQGIYALANVWLMSHSGDYSDDLLDNEYDTDSTGSRYSLTSPCVYESLKFDGGDASMKKKLIGVTVMHEPLPTLGQVVLKYRKDEETNWTTIFTHTTDNSISHDAINIESSGANFPEFNEIQFRIESTGGAVITGLKARGEYIPSNLYD